MKINMNDESNEYVCNKYIYICIYIHIIINKYFYLKDIRSNKRNPGDSDKKYI